MISRRQTGLINLNLVIVLHYISKTLWLGLAAFFGVIGFNLYAIGIEQKGPAVIDLSKCL
jgi:hypothetical protein